MTSPLPRPPRRAVPLVGLVASLACAGWIAAPSITGAAHHGSAPATPTAAHAAVDRLATRSDRTVILPLIAGHADFTAASWSARSVLPVFGLPDADGGPAGGTSSPNAASWSSLQMSAVNSSQTSLAD